MFLSTRSCVLRIIFNDNEISLIYGKKRSRRIKRLDKLKYLSQDPRNRYIYISLLKSTQLKEHLFEVRDKFNIINHFWSS